MKSIICFLVLLVGVGLPLYAGGPVAPQPGRSTLMGYCYALLSMFALGGLGILSKLAERRGCTALATVTVVFITSTLVTGAYVGYGKGANFAPPLSIVAIAIVFGVITALSSWTFLYGLKFGKISTSWVVISLSAAVPTVASTILYHERLGARKLTVLLLAAVAILLLWKDMQQDRPVAAKSGNSGGRQ